MTTTERLVGRESTLAAAESVLREAFAGAGQLLLIGGEAGIGKTSVLAALIELAGPEPLVLRGFCWEGTGAPPYWPWSQVLRATCVPTGELGEAGWLLDGTSQDVAGQQAAADARFRLFESVSRCLTRLAADRPLLVVLDDLHWADEPSLQLLGFLTKTVAGSRILLLGAYRDTEAQLPELPGHRLTLTGLGPADVETMVAALAGPPGLGRRLWQRSGGNPFFVRELTRLLLAQGTGETQIPASVAETLRRRLARLSTPCVRLLDWAAVAGWEVDVALLTHSGATEVEVLELLEEARRAGVLTGTRFAHDLYRETILGGLSAPAAASINLAVGRALQARPGVAARVAAHLLAAGPQAHREAVEHLIRAAREATARLGHDDAVTHYDTALAIIEETQQRTEILLELAAAHGRTGRSDAAMHRFREAARTARDTGDAKTLARAALGVQSLGHRSGGQSTEMIDLLRAAATALEVTDGPLSLRSQVFAALARALRHGMWSAPDAEVVATARRAVELATAAGDARALADAVLAEHDATWYPGTAERRLPITTAMLDAATESGDADLVAEAHLLRAAALLELGDPAGRDELLAYVTKAGELGHARGRWGALTRQATFAQLAGQAEEAARLCAQALGLGAAIGIPDAFGCYATCRGALVPLGIPEPPWEMDPADPMWPMFPLIKAWGPAARGDLAAAREALGDFSVLDILVSVGLEGIAVAAVVFAAVGTPEQKTWAYQRLAPHAGTHVVVGGCAAYHAAVDHHLGTLAASLGDTGAAEAHFRTALAMHERLGAAGWARLTKLALAGLEPSSGNEFRAVDGLWQLSFRGARAQLPDSKGLRDIATLIGARGANVHVFTLVGHGQHGADPVLDERAKAEFKARIDALAAELDRADDLGDAARSQRLRTERDALIHELAAATGLGGRTRRLGDEAERARKTVSARVRDALQKIDRVHPDLAGHLRDALRMGTLCSYTPREPTSWQA